MTQANLTPSRRRRIGVASAVALLHVALVLALIRAFAPDFTAQVARDVGEALSVTVITPPPSPTPTPEPSPVAPEPAGAAAPAGKRATPREAAAPKPKIVLVKPAAPPVASTGHANTSGARDAGAGTGAGGQGSGTGSGAGGEGTGGGGVATKAVKIAGDINSARDYPRATRELRLGDHVVIALTVGIDGRVRGCRVVRPSRDPEADRITCRLAAERFRFRPATNARGEPVEAVYGWRQRWFARGSE